MTVNSAALGMPAARTDTSAEQTTRGAHQGGEDETGFHQGRADGAGDLHDGAGALQVGAETHGSDWDLGETETQETERAYMISRTEAGN